MITDAEYKFLQGFLKTRSGLILQDEKQYLLNSRLLPVAQKFSLPGIGGIVAKLRQPGSAAIENAVIDAMTTNESFFFRDKTPFDSFSNFMLPALLKQRPVGQPIRIWCAAASSGQEPYSLAMLLRENASKVAGRKIEIVATDISDDMLERARSGIYTQFEVQRGLSIQLLLKYFAKNAENWQILPELRAMVDFRCANLLRAFHLGMFDIIFCRNVLIYFDVPTKLDILHRIQRTLRPDGYLVLGGAETVVGITDAYAPVPQQRGVYAPARRVVEAAA